MRNFFSSEEAIYSGDQNNLASIFYTPLQGNSGGGLTIRSPQAPDINRVGYPDIIYFGTAVRDITYDSAFGIYNSEERFNYDILTGNPPVRSILDVDSTTNYSYSHLIISPIDSYSSENIVITPSSPSEPAEQFIGEPSISLTLLDTPSARSIEGSDVSTEIDTISDLVNSPIIGINLLEDLLVEPMIGDNLLEDLNEENIDVSEYKDTHLNKKRRLNSNNTSEDSEYLNLNIVKENESDAGSTSEELYTQLTIGENDNGFSSDY